MLSELTIAALAVDDELKRLNLVYTSRVSPQEIIGEIQANVSYLSRSGQVIQWAHELAQCPHGPYTLSQREHAVDLAVTTILLSNGLGSNGSYILDVLFEAMSMPNDVEDDGPPTVPTVLLASACCVVAHHAIRETFKSIDEAFATDGEFTPYY